MRRVTLYGGPIPLPPRALEGLEVVRQSGITNMFNRGFVAELADLLGFTETSEWIRANPTIYAAGIFRGFEAASPPAKASRKGLAGTRRRRRANRTTRGEMK